MKKQSTPWDFLDHYRGRLFQGEWPTIPQMLEITCERFGERRALTALEPAALALSWREVGAAALRTAGYLSAHGVHRGDRVALTGKNSPEWAVAYLGILAAGAIVVPLDHQFGAEEMRALIRFVETPALFADEEKLEALSDSGASLSLSLAPGHPNYVLGLQAREAPAGGQASETDTAAILFTSGTTGTPKGVSLSHRNLVADCYLSQANLGVLPTDVFYALMPIHHSYTMTAVFLICVSSGAEAVFGQKMVSKHILEDLKRGRVTMFLGVPMLFNRLLIGIRKGIREKGPAVFALIRGPVVMQGYYRNEAATREVLSEDGWLAAG